MSFAEHTHLIFTVFTCSKLELRYEKAITRLGVFTAQLSGSQVSHASHDLMAVLVGLQLYEPRKGEHTSY